MSLYARLNSTATRLVRQCGARYTFTKETQGAYDPATGTAATTTSTYTACAVRDDFNSFERQDGSIEVEDIKMIAEVANFDINDTVSVDSEEYYLVNVKPIKPGATVLAYELQLRK